MQQSWSSVDAYLTNKLVPTDAALQQCLLNNAAHGLPAHDVSPPQGKFLHLLARMIGARKILEIGTLGGYSTIWLARALPTNGVVVTLEASPVHAAVARDNIAAAGVAEQVELHLAPAIETLPRLVPQAPFDLIFIDADKPSNPAYLAWALQLSRPGTVIIGDNVVRDGKVTDPTSTDANVQGVRRFIDLIADEPRLTATALQTVGSKGWDGFVMAIVG